MSTRQSLLGAEPKRAFQLYVLEHGIERFQIKIPVKAAMLFEEKFASLTSRSVGEIRDLVKTLDGDMVNG